MILPELNDWNEDGELNKVYMSYTKAVLEKKAYKIKKLLEKFEKNKGIKYKHGFIYARIQDDEDVITWTLTVRVTRDE